MGDYSTRADKAIRLILKNKLLFKNISSYIQLNHRKDNYSGLKWSEVVESPQTLIYYGYLEQFKQLISKFEERYSSSNGNVNIFEVFIEPHLIYSARHLHILQFSQQQMTIANSTYNNNIKSESQCKPINSRYPKAFPDNLIVYASKYNNLQVIKYMFDHNSTCSGDRKDELKFNLDLTQLKIAFQYAMFDGFVEVARFLCDKEPLLLNSPPKLNNSASNGHLPILEFFYEKRSQMFNCQSISNLIERASANNHMDIVEYLLNILKKSSDSSNVKFKAGVVRNICKFGSLDTIKQFINFAPNNLSLDYPAEYGRLDIVEYLHDLDSSKALAIGASSSAMDLAAGHGHLDVVKFLNSNRTEGCSANAIAQAAMNGHIDVVHFLYENRSEGCTLAGIGHVARYGLDLAKPLYKHACCLGDREIEFRLAMEAAAGHGDLEVVEFLHSQSKQSYSPLAPIVAAAKRGHLDIVRFLFENGLKRNTPANYLGAMVTPNVEVLKYLFVEKALKVNVGESGILMQLVDRGHKESLMFALELKGVQSQTNISNIMIYAGLRGEFDLAVLLLNKYKKRDAVDKLVAKAYFKLNFRLIQHIVENVNFECNVTFDNMIAWTYGHDLKRVQYMDRLLQIFENSKTTKLKLNIQSPVADHINTSLPYLHVLFRYRRVVNFYNRVLDFAIESCKYDTVKFLLTSDPTCYFGQSLYKAQNNLHMYMFVFNTLWSSMDKSEVRNKFKINGVDHKTMLAKAVYDNHLEFIKFLHDASMDKNKSQTLFSENPFDKSVMDKAAGDGRLEILEFLHNNRTEGCTTLAMDKAARYSHFKVVQFLHDNRTEGCTTNAMDGAATIVGKPLPMVQWLHNNRTEGCTFKAMDAAVVNNNFDLLEWLHSNRTEGCSDYILSHAAQQNNLQIVEFLLENRTEGNILEAIKMCMGKDSYRILEYLYFKLPKGTLKEHDPLILEWAATANKPVCTKWILENCRRITEADIKQVIKAIDKYREPLATLPILQNKLAKLANQK